MSTYVRSEPHHQNTQSRGDHTLWKETNTQSFYLFFVFCYRIRVNEILRWFRTQCVRVRFFTHEDETEAHGLAQVTEIGRFFITQGISTRGSEWAGENRGAILIHGDAAPLEIAITKSVRGCLLLCVCSRHTEASVGHAGPPLPNRTLMFMNLHHTHGHTACHSTPSSHPHSHSNTHIRELFSGTIREKHISTQDAKCARVGTSEEGYISNEQRV